MKLRFTVLFILFLVFEQANAIILPKNQLPAQPGKIIYSLAPRDIEKLTGRKMSLWQKLEWKILKNKVVKAFKKGDELTEKQQKQATASLILGLASFLLLFVPYLALLSIPLAIFAIILGIKSLKGNSNVKGIIGVVAGGFTILLFLLAVALLAAFLAGGF